MAARSALIARRLVCRVESRAAVTRRAADARATAPLSRAASTKRELALQRANHAAQELQRARDSGELIDLNGEGVEAWRPRDFVESLLTQQALVEAEHERGNGLVGWKIGATAAAAQQMLGLTSPFYGPIFESDRAELPLAAADDDDAAADAAGYALDLAPLPGLRGIELEYVLQLRDDLPAPGDGSNISVEQAALAVDAVWPGVEVVASRVRAPDGGLGDALMLIADYAGHGAMLELHGARMDWADGVAAMETRDAVRVRRGGEVVAAGDYRAPLGNPIVRAARARATPPLTQPQPTPLATPLLPSCFPFSRARACPMEASSTLRVG